MKAVLLSGLSWGQVAISVFIIGFGLIGARALSQVDADLQIIYQEYTLAAVDLAHITADVIRYRNTIIQSIESRSREEFEQLTSTLAERRARIQHAVDRYAAASLRVSRSGRSEPQDLQVVRDSLDAYFASASRTMALLIQMWNARSAEEAAALRNEAEIHAADNAGPKVIQVSLALDRLLDTVTEVAKDLRDEGTRTVHDTSLGLTVLAVGIAVMNLFTKRRASVRPSRPSKEAPEGLADAGDGRTNVQPADAARLGLIATSTLAETERLPDR